MAYFTFGKYPSGNPTAIQSPRGKVVSRGHTATASQSGPKMVTGGSAGNQKDTFNPAFDRLEEGSVVEDWIPRDLPGINKMMRGIYTRDGVAGPAVDILSLLPWSPFDLTGVEDKSIREFYEGAAKVFGEHAECMKDISTEYLVLGRFAASMLFNESKGFWDDYMPHDSDYLTITPIPIHGFDPKLDLQLSPAMNQFLSSQDYRDRMAVQSLPDKLLSKLKQGGKAIPLDPLATLWCARSVSPNDYVGTSLYTRIIPFWALEKSLLNATVTAARRRAGNILHVNVGLEDRWEPTDDEMSDIAGLFVQADEDPVGAVVVTRTGVDANEIRDSGSLWKLSDEWQYLSEGKMRALGISEALLSGEACLVGDALIQTEKGLKRIGDLGDKNKEGLQDLDITVASRYRPEKTSKWLYNGRRSTLNIETRTGHDVCCTHNHPLLVFNGSTTVWRRADSIKKGDLLCINMQKLVRSEPLVFSLPDIEDGINRNHTSKPSVMTTKLSYLLGLLVSMDSLLVSMDRYTIESNHVVFTSNDSDIVSRYVYLVLDLFGINSDIYYRFGRQDVVTRSDELVLWLQHLGLERDGHVPWSILEADEDSQLSFLAGFVEGSGQLSDGLSRIFFSSSNIVVQHQIQVMLTSHGFMAEKKGIDVELDAHSALLFWEKANKYFTSKKHFYGELNKSNLNRHLQYFITKVTNIEDGGIHDVYDISMSTDVEPAFVANGFVVHNTYTNMEQARNTFVEQLRQFRMYLTNEVYLKRFRTLARAHGFVKKKKANLDHRVRISPESHQPQRPHGPGSGNNSVEDISFDELSQEDALEIPDSDLIVPEIYWHKTLQPESDEMGMELMERLQERGFPVTLQMIASRAGQDLEEVMNSLDEDAKLREKVNEWKNKFKEEDDDGFGFASTQKLKDIKPGKAPFWDRNRSFMGLHWNEAVGFITDLSLSKPGRISNEEVLRRMNDEFDGNTHKIQAMSYLLQRLGMTSGLPVDEKRVSEIAEVISSNNNSTRGDRHRELLTLSKITSNVMEDEKKRLKEETEAAADKVNIKSQEVAKRVSSEKGLPQQNLLSGVSR